MRKRYIQDPKTFELIPIDEYQSRSPVGPLIMPDIQPYQSMVTGEMIGGRRQHREHLKQHRLIEVGNEKPVQRRPEPDRTIRNHIIEAVRRHG